MENMTSKFGTVEPCNALEIVTVADVDSVVDGSISANGFVGAGVGFNVGAGVGFEVGAGVGFEVGAGVGFDVGAGVGFGVAAPLVTKNANQC